MAKDLGSKLIRLWAHVSAFPGGRWIFSRVLGVLVPYTGSIRATVLAFEPGFCRVELLDRRCVRNHLASIHAIALANLCELASGLALLGALPSGMRGIVKGFAVQYHKKARGTLVAESRVVAPLAGEEQELRVEVSARDQAGDVVVTAQAHWKIGPQR